MDTLEKLIREVAAKHLSITINGVTANDTDGFSASVYRYPIPTDADCHLVNRRDPDPVAALRGALIEHLRWEADQKRRYDAAPKMTPKEQRHERRVEEHCIIDSDFEDLLG